MSLSINTSEVQAFRFNSLTLPTMARGTKNQEVGFSCGPSRMQISPLELTFPTFRKREHSIRSNISNILSHGRLSFQTEMFVKVLS